MANTSILCILFVTSICGIPHVSTDFMSETNFKELVRLICGVRGYKDFDGDSPLRERCHAHGCDRDDIKRRCRPAEANGMKILLFFFFLIQKL